jgi:MFS family permease
MQGDKPFNAEKASELSSNRSAPSESHAKSFLYLAASFAAIGGLLFGYDTGVISGAELFFRSEFALSTFALEVIVSGVLAGAALGALVGGRLADLFGRRKLLIATAIIFAVGAIICAAADSAAMLAVGRVIVGFGIGLSSSAVPVYISEVAPANARGWQVSLFQLAITVGILAAYVVDYAFARIHGWRWMFGIAVIPAAIFGLGMLFLPESPRWLVQHGNRELAAEMLRRIRGASSIVEELREIQEGVKKAPHAG